MGQLLNQLNDELLQMLMHLSSTGGNKLLREEKLSYYQKALEKQEVLELFFDSADADGNLFLQEPEGITVMMTAEEFRKNAYYYEAYMRATFVLREMVVIPISIDAENGIVYVKSARESSGNLRNSQRNQLRKEIDLSLDAGNEPLVYGIVRYVEEDHAVVDILGKGIRGTLQVSEWSSRYVRNLKLMVKKDDIISFHVKKMRISKRYGDKVYELSRKNMPDDAWFRIPPHYLQESAVILVECIERPISKSYWWGSSEQMKGIEIMGNYTMKLEGRIIIGAKYKCKVRKVDHQKRTIQVTPFAIVSIPDPTGDGTINIIAGKEGEENT